jgi:hypothetical protein
MSTGNGQSDEFDTPVELPPLREHVPMIQALAPLVMQLNALATNIGEVVHELRVAREPVPESGIVAKLKAAFQTLRAIGSAGEQAFEK